MAMCILMLLWPGLTSLSFYMPFGACSCHDLFGTGVGGLAATWRMRPLTTATVAKGRACGLPASQFQLSVTSKRGLLWHFGLKRLTGENVSPCHVRQRRSSFVFFQAKAQCFILILFSNLKPWIFSLGHQGGLGLKAWRLLPSCH